MNFEPRFPLDHVMTLVKSVRDESANLSSTLQLSGQILGELGALVGSTSFTFSDVETPVTLDGCLEYLEAQVSQASISSADPQFDITPFIPIIIKLIELLLARRGQ